MSANINHPDEGIIAFQEYISKVLEPSESLARLLRNAQFDVKFEHESDIDLKANFIDVAQISGALNSLVRSRLLAFAEKLHDRTGGVVVGIPKSSNCEDIVVDYEVSNVHLAPFASMMPPEKNKN